MDMLVKLYDLPDASPWVAQLAHDGIAVRRAMAHERGQVVAWVARQFGAAASGWADECELAFARMPIACWVAVQGQQIIGFACYDVAARGVFGPTGVRDDRRVQGVGSLLLVSALDDMRASGYAYAVIGHVGAAAFFAKTVAAQEIAGSTPGMYPADSIIRQPVE